MVIPGLTVSMLLLAAIPLAAQESIDPRSGRLLLTATDLVVPAGPIRLEISRTFDPQRSGGDQVTGTLTGEINGTAPVGGAKVEMGLDVDALAKGAVGALRCAFSMGAACPSGSGQPGAGSPGTSAPPGGPAGAKPPSSAKPTEVASGSWKANKA